MEKKLEELKEVYHNIPIPSELDLVVKKALKKRSPRKSKMTKVFVGLAAATTLFIGGLNISPSFAKTMADVPVIGGIAHVLTFKEFKTDEETSHADIKVPAIKDLDNEGLQSTLNKKYLKESEELYQQFKAEAKDVKENGGGHVGVESGYEVKTDNDQLLSVGRYVVNTVGSSSTTIKFDTIDKQHSLLITLPSLFKNDDYVHVISEEIKKQMITQMEKDPSIVYWVKNPNAKREDETMDIFKKIKARQNFYINNDHKLVIVFDKYEVAPGAMGIVEFVIPTEVISDLLVSHEYIK